VIGFLRQFDLLTDFKINAEVNHATLAGHTFTHEVQVLQMRFTWKHGCKSRRLPEWLGYRQFPNNLNELVEAMLIILEAGGFGGRNKLRCKDPPQFY
jgi:xylose isomerase